MAEFSNPAPGPKPKIPETVPLRQASRERQELYAPLAEMDRTDPEADGVPAASRAENIPFPKPAPELAPEAPQEPEAVQPEIPVEDRQAFLASVLAHKPYTKTYTLFGQVRVTFRDRTPSQVEQIQAELNTSGIGELPEVEQAILEERMVLAVELAHLDYGKTGEPLQEPEAGQIRKRADDLLGRFAKPLYQALLETCREFDRHVSELTRRALDKDFWQAGTENSPSPRTGPARSTSPVTAAATHTGR